MSWLSNRLIALEQAFQCKYIFFLLFWLSIIYEQTSHAIFGGTHIEIRVSHVHDLIE